MRVVKVRQLVFYEGVRNGDPEFNEIRQMLERKRDNKKEQKRIFSQYVDHRG